MQLTLCHGNWCRWLAITRGLDQLQRIGHLGESQLY